MKNRMKRYKTFIVWFLFILAVLVANKLISRVRELGVFFNTLGQVLMPFIVGFIIAFVLSIPARKLEGLFLKSKRPFLLKRARGFSVLIVYLIFFGIVSTILGFAIPWIAGNVISLVKNVPTYYNTVVDFVNGHITDSTIAGINISALLETITPQKVLANFDMSSITSYASGVFKFGSGVVKVFIAVIISIYMLLGKESILRALKQLIGLVIPKRGQQVLFHYGQVICDTFYKYIYGQCLDACILGAACILVFTLIGVPYGALLGICVGLANLIPYFGAILSGIGVAVFTLIASGPLKAIIVAVAILVIQQIDGNIMQPKIVGSNVGIKPLYVLLAITVGGGFFGVPGMIIGVPTISVLRTMVLDLITYKEQKNASAEAATPTPMQTAVGNAAEAAEHIVRHVMQTAQIDPEEADETEPQPDGTGKSAVETDTQEKL